MPLMVRKGQENGYLVDDRQQAVENRQKSKVLCPRLQSLSELTLLRTESWLLHEALFQML